MSTLQQHKGLVSLLVFLSLVWSGSYVFKWVWTDVVAREFFMVSLIFVTAATAVLYEGIARFASWNEDRQTRPARSK